MLKEGNDHFEVTRQEPQVNVCERRYVFNADPAQRLSFSPAAQCPASETPDSIVAAVGAKQRRDASRIAELIKRGTPTAPVRTYADGGMHPVFAEAVERRRAGGYSLASVPGTIPNHVQPPRPRAGATSAPAASSPTALTYADAGAGDVATGTAPNLFNNLFSGSDSSAQQSRTAASSGGDSSGGGNALSRVASWMGLRGSAETQRPAPPTPAAVSRTRREPARATTPRPQRTATPTPVPVREASAAPAWPEPRPEARPPETGSNPQAGTEERRDPAATEPQRQNAPGATMAGAAPTIPAGSFDNRWVSFR